LKDSIRKYYFGAELIKDKGVSFSVWAPEKKTIHIKLLGGKGYKPNLENLFSLTKDKNGFFTGISSNAGEGTLYKIIIDNNKKPFPDIASRFQPEGPHGPSMVIDQSFNWSDSDWEGTSKTGQVLYEMHIGTFTKEGTWQSAAAQLKELAELGITIIEIMPIGEFPGKFGWGYDGVDLFAPFHFYGTPTDIKTFINKAHKLNIGVILDVVYNHIGPDGNYFKEYTSYFFSNKHKTDWGEAINYDDKNSKYVRTFILENAAYWIDDFHFDGLRLDATQNIYDDSLNHILKEISILVKQKGGKRKTFLIAENEPQDIKIVKPFSQNGYEFDGMWNDDFHHSARVALTGKNEAYYSDYKGTPQEFISSFKYGFLFQGQWYKWQSKRRGVPSLNYDARFYITYIQNHDQIANSSRGLRISKLTSFAKLKAFTCLMILAPGTPLLFMGQEFASTSPFNYFADHNADLSKLVYQGRIEFLKQFRSLASPEMTSYFPDPSKENTFLNSKLNFQERISNKEIYQLHKDLIHLKRTDPVFKLQDKRKLDGAVLRDNAFIIRFFDESNNDRIILINLGADFYFNPAPEPLLAPPENSQWVTLFSSENPVYGGDGTVAPGSDDKWIIPANAAVVLRAN
jgi:maltooligosyltrehalose trehalohydrolase